MPLVIIDFHTHIFPPRTANKILLDVNHRAGVPYFTNGTVQGLIDSMSDANIDISVVSRITPRSDQVNFIHKWLRALRQDCIIPMATWHPELPINPELISKLKSQGFKCVKFHPDYQDFFIDEKRMYPFYEAAQAEDMPILFHAGFDRGLPPPLHAPPEKLAIICRAFPRLRIIAAHMGGEDNYNETEKYLLGTEIYLDTSFVLRKMPVSLFKLFIRKHPIERILFGSDSPWTDQAQELNYLLSLPFLKEDEIEKITGMNAARILGLHI